jgi:hypothetical protein
VTWQDVLDGIDAVESWIVAQSFWVQVVLLLMVLGPICWLLAGLIDRFVESVLRRLRALRARAGEDPSEVGGEGVQAHSDPTTAAP